MEVCRVEANCRVTDFLSNSFNSNQLHSSPHPNNLSCPPSLPNSHSSLSLSNQGFNTYKYFPLRSAKSDDISSGTNQFPNAELDNFENTEDRNSYEVHGYGKDSQNETPRDEAGSMVNVHHDEAYEEGSLLDVKNKIAEFVDNLNLKFDSEDSYSIALYGSSAAAALYLATAVIGALDSIPLFPKLMEVVGLGYSVWFTNRYLLFKKNRDELAAKIEELKQQVLGSEDE